MHLSLTRTGLFFKIITESSFMQKVHKNPQGDLLFVIDGFVFKRTEVNHTGNVTRWTCEKCGQQIRVQRFRKKMEISWRGAHNHKSLKKTG